ncbi:MAG: hypothetical protein V3W06_05535, partial [Acidimicrobiia bacterium]
MSILDVTIPLSPVMLTLGVGGTIGVLAAALALGIRHGIDWDHIAAITDITSTTAAAQDSEERWLTGEPGVMLTDESHHSLAAGSMGASAVTDAQIAIGADAPVAVGVRPDQAAPPLPAEAAQAARPHPNGHQLAGALASLPVEQRRALFLGSLYALGHGTVVILLGLLAILARQFLPSGIDPVLERVVGVTLILLAAYLIYSLYRFFRGHGEFRIRSRWMLIFAGVRNGFNWLRSRVSGEHPHDHDVHGVDQYGVRTA